MTLPVKWAFHCRVANWPSEESCSNLVGIVRARLRRICLCCQPNENLKLKLKRLCSLTLLGWFSPLREAALCTLSRIFRFQATRKITWSAQHVSGFCATIAHFQRQVASETRNSNFLCWQLQLLLALLPRKKKDEKSAVQLA